MLFNYNPQPGILLDASYLFSEQFSLSETKKLSHIQTCSSEMQSIYTALSNCPAELLIFFSPSKYQKSYYFRTLLCRLLENHFSSFSFKTIEEYFADPNVIISDLLHFYYNLDFSSTEYDPASIESLLYSESYQKRFLCYFLGFLINPQRYIQLFLKTLRNLSNLLEKYLQEKTPVLPTENSFSLFCENFDYLFDHALPAKNDITIHLSYCHFYNKQFFTHFSSTPYWLLVADSLINSSITTPMDLSIIHSSINDIGHVLSDTTRVSILLYLKSHPNTSIKELSSYLHVSTSCTNYNMQYLLKAKFVTGISSGKKILYRINKDALIQATAFLQSLYH